MRRKDAGVGKRSFKLGVHDLDRQYSHVIRPGTVILIAGHPGAGKTTFAALTCFVNASNGKPCLYISFNEEKEKFMEWIRGLGFDFSSLESRGLFKFVKLPILTEDTLFSTLMGVIAENVSRFRPAVIVIDSITPMGEVLGPESARARSFLQNFITNLAKRINGIVVLVAEIPLSTERVSLGSAEFVADMVVIMKHRIEGSRLVRIMELRKVRGAPINVAEIPFAIREGEGIRVFTPPIMRGEARPNTEVKYVLGCRLFTDTINHLHPGSTLVFLTPPKARGLGVAGIALLELVARYGLKVALISYRLTSAEVKHYFNEFLTRYGVENVERLWRHIVSAEGVNPTAHSLEEVLHKVLDTLERGPDVVVLHGVENLFMVYRDKLKAYNSLFNIVQHHKSLGVMTVIHATKTIDEISNILSNLADVVIEEFYKPHERLGTLYPYTYVWSIGKQPRTIGVEEVRECVEDLLASLRRIARRGEGGGEG